MRPGHWLLSTALACLVSASAFSRDGGTKAKAPEISLPSFADIPKAENLKPPQVDRPDERPSATETHFSVVKIEHAKSFRSSTSGNLPVGGALAAISLSGNPPSTERFSTLVRIKSHDKVAAPIRVAILDPQGNPALSADGQLSFHGVKGDQVDYLVEWDPTPCRAGGAYQVTVRVAGQELGSWPLRVMEAKEQPAQSAAH
jgi:hypothetical protein